MPGHCGYRDISHSLSACLWFVCETIIIYDIPVLPNIIIERASARFGDQVRCIWPSVWSWLTKVFTKSEGPNMLYTTYQLQTFYFFNSLLSWWRRDLSRIKNLKCVCWWCIQTKYKLLHIFWHVADEILIYEHQIQTSGKFKFEIRKIILFKYNYKYVCDPISGTQNVPLLCSELWMTDNKNDACCGRDIKKQPHLYCVIPWAAQRQLCAY